MATARILLGALLVSLVAGCSAISPILPRPLAVPGRPQPGVTEEARYAAVFPYYAEICALSELKKRPGFGADIFSGIGGHGVMYLNKVCRRQDSEYPVLDLCGSPQTGPAGDGVGLSVNGHYANAVWDATEGRNFFFTGGLDPGETLTHERYRHVQDQAVAQGIYAGVDFHESYFADIPAGFSRERFKYEISVATDYAIAFGRNRYCARVPLDRSQMLRVVAYLNAINQPYRRGDKIFDWNLFAQNCSHVTHNALAAAGLWRPWPIDRPVAVSVFDFPVPMNEVVNILRRGNDLPIDDLEVLYRDTTARELLLRDGHLPTEPGTLLDVGTILPRNDVYQTRSRVIFYDDPFTGRYHRDFETIRSDPRYFQLRENLVYFAGLYGKITQARKPLDWYVKRHPWQSRAERQAFALFYLKYFAYIARQTQVVAGEIAVLDRENPSSR